MGSKSFFMGLLFVALAVLAASCGRGGGGINMPSTPSSTSTPIGPVKSFNLDIRNGALTGASTFTVSQGDTAVFYLTSDQPGTINVQGYDYAVAFTPEVPALLTFTANAVGHYNLTLGPAQNDGGAAAGGVGGASTVTATAPRCPDLPGASVTLMVRPGSTLGQFIATAKTQDFKLGSGGNGWDLYVDGELADGSAVPDTTVTLDPGVHELRAVLSNVSGCEYPAASSYMVGYQSQGASANGGGSGGGQPTLGSFVVNPR